MFQLDLMQAEFIGKIVIHERDKKRAKQTFQYVEVYFNYIGRKGGIFKFFMA